MIINSIDYLKFNHLILCIVVGSNLFIPAVFAVNNQLSNEISLHNDYQYRLITRQLTTNPNQSFSDNVRPLAERELALINFKPVTSRNYALVGLAKFQPVQDVRLQAIHNNESNTLVNSNYGEKFAGNNNGTLNISGDSSINELILLSHDARIQYDQSSSKLSLYRFRLKTAFSHISVSYAKDSLLLGPGYFGNLFTSDNVQPYQIALFKTEIPYVVPVLGSFRWYLWHSWFNNDEPRLPDTKMLGIRLSLKPNKLVEFGLTRTSTYGGNGQNINSFTKLSSVITAKDENASTDINTDQLVGMDAALYLPFLRKASPFLGGKLYTEYVWNDIVAFWQTEDRDDSRLFELLGKSYLYGIYLTTGKLDFHFEYINTAGALYAHSTLGSTGSSVNGYLIGHFIGRDASAYLSEIYYEWNRQIHVSVNMGRIKRLQRPSNNQYSTIYGLGIKYFYSQKIQMELKTNYIFTNKKDIDPSPIYYNFINDSRTDWQSIVNITYRL